MGPITLVCWLGLEDKIMGQSPGSPTWAFFSPFFCPCLVCCLSPTQFQSFSIHHIYGCRCATVGIMLVSLSLSLALLISPVPSCLLGPELAFPVARKTGSSPSKRGSPAISKHRDFSHCWHCHWGQFRIYLHWFDREPENQLTCIVHYTAVIRYSKDKLMLVLAPEKMRAFGFFPLQLYSL